MVLYHVVLHTPIHHDKRHQHMKLTARDPKLSRAFGRAIQALRRQRKPPLSQENLALEADVERAHMGAIERGEHDPRLSTLWKLKAALKVSLARLAREIERHYSPSGNEKNKAK